MAWPTLHARRSMPSLRRPRAALDDGAEAPGAAARAERDARLAGHLQHAAAGSAAAFEAFYDATFGFARALARRLLRGAEVDDLLADAYFEAWRNVTRFDPARGSAVTWLLTLVRSRALDARRAAAARPRSAGATGELDPPAAADGADAADRAARAKGPDLPTGADPATGAEGADPADRLWRRQCGAELQQALLRLSAAERWVLGLAYLRELSHAEIARCTGMPLGTVKSHAQRAQTKLRAALANLAEKGRPMRPRTE